MHKALRRGVLGDLSDKACPVNMHAHIIDHTARNESLLEMKYCLFPIHQAYIHQI